MREGILLKVETAGYIFEEKRRSTREQVELDAKGIVPNADKAIDCTILDISDTGALVRLGEVDIIPPRFKLFVPERHMLCECRIVRKSGKFLGIEFQTRAGLDENGEDAVLQ